MKKKEAKNIIVKFINSEATNKERENLFKWLQHIKNKELFKDFIKTEYLIDHRFNSFDSEEAFTSFLEHIKETKRGSNISRLLKYAAIFIGILFLGIYFFNRNHNTETFIDPNSIILEIHNGSREAVSIISDMEVTDKNGRLVGTVKNNLLTVNRNLNRKQGKDKSHSSIHILKIPYGKKFQVILADGSAVHLNSGSVLKYPSNFNNLGVREVQLQGEAYFNVAKNKNKPFLVRTENLHTKVYGTEFNVSAYENDKTTKVVLVEGSVGVGYKSSDEETFLKTSQKASVTKKHREIEVVNVETDIYTAWTRGILLFKNSSMKNIIRILERNFNVEIQNKYPELNDRRFTGNFDYEDIDEILHTIQTHTRFSFIREGNKIIIDKP